MESETIFPEGFNPKEHGMIPVDENGNPIEPELESKIPEKEKPDTPPEEIVDED